MKIKMKHTCLVCIVLLSGGYLALSASRTVTSTAKPPAINFGSISLPSEQPFGTARMQGALGTANKKNFVSALNSGEEVNAQATVIGSTEIFTVVGLDGEALKSGDRVNLQTANKLFVCAEGGGGGSVSANREEAREWETFTIWKIGGDGLIGFDDAVTLKTWDNAHYLVAEKGGGSALTAESVAVGGDETFTLRNALFETDPPTYLDLNRVAFRTRYQNLYLSAINGGGSFVRANGIDAGPFENFKLTDINGGSLNGYDLIYVQPHNRSFYFNTLGVEGAELRATGTQASYYEKFMILKMTDGGSISGPIVEGDTVALLAWIDYRLAVAENGYMRMKRNNESNSRMTIHSQMADLDMQYIARTPRYPWNQTQKWPNPGELVTFEGQIANRGNAFSGLFNYAWYVDGTLYAQGTHQGLAPNATDVLRFNWVWLSGTHTVKLVLDTGQTVREISERNNSVEDRTNALAVGVYVEQSVVDFFNNTVFRSGNPNSLWGGNSWEDWVQHQISIWNEKMRTAAPTPGLERLRVDKFVIVPDHALQCQTNNPAIPILGHHDFEIDLIWGFPSAYVVPYPQNGCGPGSPGYRDDPNNWNYDQNLFHEINHARYVVDLYGFNAHIFHLPLVQSISATGTELTIGWEGGGPPPNEFYGVPTHLVLGGEIVYCQQRIDDPVARTSRFTQCQRGAEATVARSHNFGVRVYGGNVRIQDGWGNALLDGPGLPRADGDKIHQGIDFFYDIMNAGSFIGAHTAYAWNRIFNQRPVCGNANAPCNIGEYLADLPQSNLLELRETNGQILAGAQVEIYRANPFPGWYGKRYAGEPLGVIRTDAQGRADLGSMPFGACNQGYGCIRNTGLVHTNGLANGVLLLKIVHNNRVGVQFLEVTRMNLEYARGNTQQAIYPITFNRWANIPSNSAPNAMADSYGAGMNRTLIVSAPGVLANDGDPDGDALTARLFSGPSHGTLNLSGNGSFTYTPANNFTGTDSFRYQARDVHSNYSNVVTVTISVMSDH